MHVLFPVPKAPSNVTVTVLNTSSMVVTWVKPENENNSHCDISHYTVSWSSADLNEFTQLQASADKTNYTISGLAPKCEYNITVMAGPALGVMGPYLKHFRGAPLNYFTNDINHVNTHTNTYVF